jgi:tryptophan halogenase
VSGAAERAIRSICVAGDGIVGLSAALAFSRALPRVRIEVLALPADPAALADRLPSTLPHVLRFHAAIGFDELDLVRAGIATHRIGTRYEGWSADGASWHHAFGDTFGEVGGARFDQAWLRARAAGRAAAYERHNAAAVLAASHRFVHPDGKAGSPLASYVYALRLDPPAYRARLAAACEKRGVIRTEGALGGVERREDGGAAALLLTDGRRIEADLFVDCAGPGAPVLSALDGAFEDWSAWLPCDRLRIGVSAGGRADPVDVVEAQAEGWRWMAPLPDRLLGGFAFASALAGDARTAELFPAGETVAIRPGRRPAPWVRNVLAIGDAAAAVDPLEGTNLHLAQAAILRAIELMPGRDCHPLELAEFNRRTEWETLRVRDFIALHYLRSGRRDGPFWSALAGRAPPETLAATLEQWERRGRLPFFEEESFERESWAASLFGLGILPRHPDPAASGVPLDRSAEAIARHAERLAGLPARLPSYPDYLSRMRSTPPPQTRR